MSEREAPVDQAATSTPSSTRRPPSARLSGIDLPAQQLATGDRLAEQHAALREHGVHHRDGGWVIAQAPDVTDATLESTVCRRGGYTSTVRPPTSITNSENRLAQAAYGQSDGPSAYELDHLVPLELGGTPNSAANLWPEPGSSPNPKDKLESALHDLLCAHRITLTAAQHMIATDWTTAYRQILGTPPPG